MSLPHDHSEEPEILPWQMGEDISRPEPAASARAYLPPLETSGVLVPSAIVPPYSLYSKEATSPLRLRGHPHHTIFRSSIQMTCGKTERDRLLAQGASSSSA